LPRAWHPGRDVADFPLERPMSNKEKVSRRDFLRTTALASGGLALGIGCGDNGSSSSAPDSSVPSDSSAPPAPKPFTVVALPDTQNYADQYPEIFLAQTRWIADNRDKENIVFVTHLGDIVDNGPSVRQWKNAREAMDLLDAADIPHGTCLGNHDVQYSDSEYKYPADVNNACSAFSDIDCDAKHYMDAFGPKRYAGKSWYGGASPSGQSNYQLISAGGIELLFLHLAVDARVAELEWGKQVVSKHPDAAVHVSTHRYMYDLRMTTKHPYPLSNLLGGRYDDLFYTFDQDPYYNDASKAEDLFQNLVKPNKNVFMVQCGHFDAELRVTSENAAKQTVHEILVDYQTYSPKGGDGWMRLCKFDVAQGEIEVRTYSPTLKRFRENGDGYDGSLLALRQGIAALEGQFGKVFDTEAMKKQIDYWDKDPAGRKEGFEALYGDGRRDSEFTLEVDFSPFTGKGNASVDGG
jgi:hypothetical protein